MQMYSGVNTMLLYLMLLVLIHFSVLGSRHLGGMGGEERPWVHPTGRRGSRDSSEQSERPRIGGDKTHSRSRSPHRK